MKSHKIKRSICWIVLWGHIRSTEKVGIGLFFCNRAIRLSKSQTHVSKYCNFHLSADIEKNPGPTPMYIDSCKTITASHSQTNELVFRTNVCCNESICSMIYNNKQGINYSAFDLQSMNIGNYKTTKIVRVLWLARRRVCMRVCKHGCVT